MKPLSVFFLLLFASVVFAQQATPPNILVADSGHMSWLGAATIAGKTYLSIGTVTPGPAIGGYWSTNGGDSWNGNAKVPDTTGNNPWGGFDLHTGYAYMTFFTGAGSFVARS